ncbi:hypothetical protein [Mycobacterium sp. 852013-50091_SCH5140682]|nr:hypothetical protein [Mycobacterium sp. 852013-50091_SCH5140682]
MSDSAQAWIGDAMVPWAERLNGVEQPTLNVITGLEPMRRRTPSPWRHRG